MFCAPITCTPIASSPNPWILNNSSRWSVPLNRFGCLSSLCPLASGPDEFTLPARLANQTSAKSEFHRGSPGTCLEAISMNTAPVNILLVEDSPSDAVLLQECLSQNGLGDFRFTLA